MLFDAMAKPIALAIAVVLVAAVLVLAIPSRPAPPIIREEQAVLINGVMETWQLRWLTAPEPWCEVDGSWPTYPCLGFSYGEAGKLDLVRYRNGSEYERLQLTPFSTGFPDHGAVLQRWPFEEKDVFHDFHPINSPEMNALRSRVRARRPVKIMSLADYDQDGNATEFFFQTEAGAFHRWGIVVGVSASNPHLHAFGTVLHPNTALVMQPNEWEALRTAKGAVRVMDWKCPDHGAETDTEYELEATPKGIRVISREYAECGKEPRRLIKQEDK
jgi:hypothetical protein